MRIVIEIRSNTWNGANKELEKIEKLLDDYEYITIDVEE